MSSCVQIIYCLINYHFNVMLWCQFSVMHIVYINCCVCVELSSLYSTNHQLQAFTQSVHCPVVCSVYEGFSMKTVAVFVNFLLLLPNIYLLKWLITIYCLPKVADYHV